MMDYKQLCMRVNELVSETGKFIQQEALTFSSDKIEIKGKHDLVSYVDKQAEIMLVAGLQELLPEAGFVTEEKTINKKGDLFNWIVDPLDGTTNFMHGLPVYSISVGLQEGDQMVLGVVIELNRNELFYAWKDSPAYLNGMEIHVSSHKELGDSLVATGFPYSNFIQIDSYMSLMKEMMIEAQGLRRLGSAAIDLCFVACGRFESYFEFNINSYDVAGGLFIVQQAGGQVSTFSEKRDQIADVFESRQMLASNGHIHSRMSEIIQANFKA